VESAFVGMLKGDFDSQAPHVYLAPQQYAVDPPAAVQGPGAAVGFWRMHF